VAAATLLSACAYGNEVRAPFHQTIAVAGPVTFSLTNTAGTVRIEAWNEPRIEITGEKTGATTAIVNAITVDIKHVGSAVTVATEYPQGATSGGAVYVVHLPASTPLTVSNTAGTVRINGMTSDVNASSSAGTIDVAMARLTGKQNVTLQTSTGTVSLLVPHASDATFATHQTIGSTKSALPPTVGKGTATVDVTTTVGSITIGWNENV
jgi:hypothetical protein